MSKEIFLALNSGGEVYIYKARVDLAPVEVALGLNLAWRHSIKSGVGPKLGHAPLR